MPDGSLIACVFWSAVPNTNSHSSGCAERVKMSSWSWRSLRSSACAIANVPAASRPIGLTRSAAGRSAEPLGHATLGADIGEPPFLRVDRVPGDGHEDLLEAVGLVL